MRQITVARCFERIGDNAAASGIFALIKVTPDGCG